MISVFANMLFVLMFNLVYLTSLKCKLLEDKVLYSCYHSKLSMWTSPQNSVRLNKYVCTGWLCIVYDWDHDYRNPHSLRHIFSQVFMQYFTSEPVRSIKLKSFLTFWEDRNEKYDDKLSELWLYLLPLNNEHKINFHIGHS